MIKHSIQQFASKAIKPLKKIKGTDQLPPPYINFMDSLNADFLQFQNQKQKLKANPSQISVVDHKSIEAKVEDDKEKNPFIKDLVFIGRSNVGKSSLVNSLCGL